jgi:hypothetical protein
MNSADTPANEPPETDQPQPARDGRSSHATPVNPFREDGEIFDAELLSKPVGSRPFRFELWGERLGPSQSTFHVPKRFGMSAILGITTAMAILFGFFRAFGAHEVMYLFFGMLAMVICIVQMRFDHMPRQASIIAGAVMLPLFLIGLGFFARRIHFFELVCMLGFSIPVGAFLGYVTGTFAGGIFLLMDLFEKYWTRKSTAVAAK